MPAESIVALIVIMAIFTFFSVVLAWASRNAPPTFPDAAPRRSETAQPAHNRQSPIGAH